MAIPLARVHLAMAHAALPALLPTPPKWKMMPLLPTPPCALVILPMPSPPKPGRADAVERWDAHKTVKPAASPASSSGSGKSTGSPGRASSCERWDSNKKTTATSSSSSTSTSRSSSSSASQSRASSGDKWGSNKRRPGTGSRASSAERWDAHKKPRPPRADGVDDDGQSSTGSNDMPQRAFYAGPGFLASPEPSVLPMPPSFMVRVAA